MIDLDRDVKPDIDEVYSNLGADPAKYLFAFLAMCKSRKRHMIGFDRNDLDWISRAWREAANATDRGRLRDLCLHESERYASLARNLVQGELERREEGIVFLNDKRDWPHVNVIKASITALSTAGIRTLQ